MRRAVSGNSLQTNCGPFSFSGLPERLRAVCTNPRAGFLPGLAAVPRGVLSQGREEK